MIQILVGPTFVVPAREILGNCVDPSEGSLVGPLLDESVEELRRSQEFETMIQNTGSNSIIMSANEVSLIECCVIFDGPEFFNTLR